MKVYKAVTYAVKLITGFLPRMKSNAFRMILLCVLLAAALLSISAIANYKSDIASSPHKIEQSSPPQFGTNQMPRNVNQVPGGQLPSSNSVRMAPPNGGVPSGLTNDGTKYAPQIILYSIIFFIIVGYGIFAHRKIKIDAGNEKLLILTLLCVGLLLRISFATLVVGDPFDINFFKEWAIAAANNLSQFYAGHNTSDYPPLYIYVLYVVGKIANMPGVNPYFLLLLKLPSMAADIVTSFLIYKLAKKYVSLELSILASVFYVFNPAVFMNSTYWGQVDSFFTLIVISSVILLVEQKIGAASVLFVAAVLMKPQGIIFLPVLLFELIRLGNLRKFLIALVSAVATVVILILPFSLNKNPLWLFKLFSSTVGEYRFASVNAFNFFSLLGANYKNDSATLFVFSYYTWGMIFIVAITVLSWLILIKGNDRAFVPAIALLQIAGVFTLSARMHERYLFPAVALSILAFIYLKDKRLLLLGGGFSVTTYINTHFVLFETSVGISQVPFGPVLIFTSFLNVLLLLCLIVVVLDISIRKHCVLVDGKKVVSMTNVVNHVIASERTIRPANILMPSN